MQRWHDLGRRYGANIYSHQMMRVGPVNIHEEENL